MGKFKPFQHDEMVAAGKAKPYSRSDYKTKEMQENAKGGGSEGGGGSVVYFPISIDMTGDTPDVTTTVSITDITAAIKAGNYVILEDVGAEHVVSLYPFINGTEAYLGTTPQVYESIFTSLSVFEGSAEVINIICRDDYDTPENSGFEVEITELTVSGGD